MVSNIPNINNYGSVSLLSFTNLDPTRSKAVDYVHLLNSLRPRLAAADPRIQISKEKNVIKPGLMRIAPA